LEVEIAQGKISEKRNDTFANYTLNQNILDRYAPFYPLSQINHQLSLREGFTPLIQTKHAIANPYPPSGNELLRKLRMVDGMATTVSDNEALESQVLLAKEGIFAQPAAAVSIAAIKKLRANGNIDKKSKCVAIITGSGLKYTGILNKHSIGSETCTLKTVKEKIVSILEK